MGEHEGMHNISGHVQIVVLAFHCTVF